MLSIYTHGLRSQDLSGMLSPNLHRLWSGVKRSPRHTNERHPAGLGCSLNAEVYGEQVVLNQIREEV